jgi:glutathione synthase/RimK-type ligase-like ATP-grasp enzyme
LNLDVWGVDFILTEHGPIIIDVNDFPSFNACRDVAAPLIADYVMQAAEL